MGGLITQEIKPLLIRDADVNFHGSLTHLLLLGMPSPNMGQRPGA